MSNEKSNSIKRTRNYATVVYPESAPPEWMDILSNQFVPVIISPLHDSDVNPGGEIKKSHYHVLLCFEGPKTREQACEIFQLIGGAGCEVVQSLRGYARYLCHLDNPEKAQYSIDDVKCLCGADFNSIISLPTDKYKAIREMMEFCYNNNVFVYSDLLEYCANERFDWFRVLCDNGTVVIKEYLKSRFWKFKNDSL